LLFSHTSQKPPAARQKEWRICFFSEEAIPEWNFFRRDKWVIVASIVASKCFDKDVNLMETRSTEEITLILHKAVRGDTTAVNDLMPLVYSELRALAGSYFRSQRPEHTLQPTALVHESFVKLVGASHISWESRAHFFEIAAKAMREILADHARRKKAAKRGGGQKRITLFGLITPLKDAAEIDLVALDEALAKLNSLSERQARIVEMRFLAGLSEKDVAHVLGVNTRTVQRDWRAAKAFLKAELSGDAL